MHNCAFMSDQLQIELDMTERTTGPSIKTARPTSLAAPVAGPSARIWRSVTHGITPH